MTIEQTWLTAAGVKDTTKWLPHISATCERFKINTPRRVACFLAQTAHESNGYTVLSENLNYSAKGLIETFPRYFRSLDAASAFARKPEKIANRVYGNRLGNTDEGDGWKFRGRGLIQFTGRENYAKLTLVFGIDFLATPDLLLEPMYAALSAGQFWEWKNLNQFADSNMMKSVTQRINGGFNGYADRVARWNAVKQEMKIV